MSTNVIVFIRSIYVCLLSLPCLHHHTMSTPSYHVYVYTIIPFYVCSLVRHISHVCLCSFRLHTVTCVYNRSSDCFQYRLLLPIVMSFPVRLFKACVIANYPNNYPWLRPRLSRSPKLTNKLVTPERGISKRTTSTLYSLHIQLFQRMCPV